MNNTINWDGETPQSSQYGDTYFSTDSGLSESSYVFILHNDLAEKFKTAKNHTIAELGFGFGLNFLATAAEWKKSEPGDDQYLDYIGIEQSPPLKKDLIRALSPWPQLNTTLDELIAHYPPPTDGVIRADFPEHHIRLTLYIGEASWALNNISSTIDTWYLDGFSPSKNPEMWSESLFKKMAGLSRDNASFATFTAASAVRRGLTEAGFGVKKAKGYGKKREMLYGNLKQPQKKPVLPAHFCLPPARKIKKIAVIGAGLAGCAQAAALAARGFDVHLIEQEKQICSGGSAVPQASLKPIIHLQNNPYDHFYNSGFLYTISTIKRLQKNGIDSGAEKLPTLLLAHDEKSEKRIHAYVKNKEPNVSWAQYLNARESSEFSGINLQTPSLLLPSTYRIRPLQLALALLSQWESRINLCLSCQVDELIFTADSVLLKTNRGDQHFDYVIVADAFTGNLLNNVGDFNVSRQAGQTTCIKQPEQSLQCQLAYGGYCLPCDQELHLGSTYRDVLDKASKNSADDQNNITAFNNAIQCDTFNLSDVYSSHTGFRCQYKDHLPLIGPVMREQTFHKDYKRWLIGDRRFTAPPADYLPLSLTTAFGSKGLLGSLIAAEHNAAMLCNTPSPLSAQLIKSVHPNRVWVNRLKGKGNP